MLGWNYCWGQNRSRRNQCRKSPEKYLLRKKKDKIQKNREARKTKSSFVTNPKKIHAINLRERVLKASDNGSREAKHPSSNSPNGRVGPTTPSNSPNERVGPTTPFNLTNERVVPTMPSNSSNERVGPTTPSNSSNERVGPTTTSNSPVLRKLPSSHTRSSLFSDRIELTLVSSRSESPSELYSLETTKNSFSRRKFGLMYKTATIKLNTFNCLRYTKNFDFLRNRRRFENAISIKS